MGRAAARRLPGWRLREGRRGARARGRRQAGRLRQRRLPVHQRAGTDVRRRAGAGVLQVARRRCDVQRRRRPRGALAAGSRVPALPGAAGRRARRHGVPAAELRGGGDHGRDQHRRGVVLDLLDGAARRRRQRRRRRGRGEHGRRRCGDGVRGLAGQRQAHPAGGLARQGQDVEGTADGRAARRHARHTEPAGRGARARAHRDRLVRLDDRPAEAQRLPDRVLRRRQRRPALLHRDGQRPGRPAVLPDRRRQLAAQRLPRRDDRARRDAVGRAGQAPLRQA